MSLTYHAGQVEVQQEANTRPVAEMLRDWVGPIGEFTLGADLIILAAQVDGAFEFAVLSGAPPLVEPAGGFALQFPAPLFPQTPDGSTRQVGVRLPQVGRVSRHVPTVGLQPVQDDGCVQPAAISEHSKRFRHTQIVRASPISSEPRPSQSSRMEGRTFRSVRNTTPCRALRNDRGDESDNPRSALQELKLRHYIPEHSKRH